MTTLIYTVLKALHSLTYVAPPPAALRRSALSTSPASPFAVLKRVYSAQVTVLVRRAHWQRINIYNLLAISGFCQAIGITHPPPYPELWPGNWRRHLPEPYLSDDGESDEELSGALSRSRVSLSLIDGVL